MKKPVFYSTITICIAVPAWFLWLSFFWSSRTEDINTAGIFLYGVILSVVTLPFAFIVSFVMSSILNKLQEKSQLRLFFIISIFHGIILACLCLFYIYSSSITTQWTWTNLFIIPFYFMLFLTLPSLAGCTVCFLLSKKKQMQS